MYGRELTSAVDIAFGCPRPAASSVNDYARYTRECMAEAYAMVRDHWGRCAVVMKDHYDAAVRPAEFQEGDLVWYFCPKARLGTSPKCTRFYSGPYRVVRKVNDVNYIIQLSLKSRQWSMLIKSNGTRSSNLPRCIVVKWSEIGGGWRWRQRAEGPGR